MSVNVRQQIITKLDTLLRSILTDAVVFSGATGDSEDANGTYYRSTSILYIQATDSSWTIKYTAGTTTWAVRKTDGTDPDIKMEHFTRVSASIAGAYTATEDGEGDEAAAAVTTEGNYETNLGESVYEWQEAPLAEDAGPACSYKDTVTVRNYSSGLWEHTMALELFLYGNTPAQVRQMIADVLKAIGTKPTWDGLAKWTRLVGEDTGADQKNRKVFISHLTFNVQYTTVYWSAYQ